MTFVLYLIQQNLLNVKYKDVYNNNIIHLLAHDEKYNIVIQSLINKGVDINHDNIDNTPSIIKAIERGNLELVDILIKNKANLIVHNYMFETPLMISTNGGMNNITLRLLQEDVYLGIINEFDDTPLMNASFNGNIKIVEKLLEYDSYNQYTNLYNSEGNNALLIAISNNNYDIIKILIPITDLYHENMDKFNSITLLDYIFGSNWFNFNIPYEEHMSHEKEIYEILNQYR